MSTLHSGSGLRRVSPPHHICATGSRQLAESRGQSRVNNRLQEDIRALQLGKVRLFLAPAPAPITVLLLLTALLGLILRQFEARSATWTSPRGHLFSNPASVGGRARLDAIYLMCSRRQGATGQPSKASSQVFVRVHPEHPSVCCVFSSHSKICTSLVAAAAVVRFGSVRGAPSSASAYMKRSSAFSPFLLPALLRFSLW